jgi:hypothetical protein
VTSASSAVAARSDNPEAGTSGRRRRVLTVMRVIEPAALAFLVVARQYGVIADVPLWLYAAVLVGPIFVSRWLDRWTAANQSAWRLHVRVAFHAATVMAVIYVTGWGPALGLCFVYAAIIDMAASGAESWPIVLGWSLAAIAAGQALLLFEWLPSKLDATNEQVLGWLGAIGVAIVIRITGAVFVDKQRVEDELARSEAQYRS